MSRRGKFITFEGLDGTGKSTQMRKLAVVLREAGHKVIETREPGGTPTAEKIRKVLLDSGTAGLGPLAEMALMFASRAQHIAEVIEPGLAAGNIVLCDRFTDSTEAYQGSGRRLGSEPVRELHRILCGNLQPDLTILMDSNPHASVRRARRRNQRASKSSGRSHDENRSAWRSSMPEECPNKPTTRFWKFFPAKWPSLACPREFTMVVNRRQFLENTALTAAAARFVPHAFANTSLLTTVDSKKAYGSGYFGAWIEDELGLPAFHYTCDQINDKKAVTEVNAGVLTSTEHIHQVGN